MSLFDSVCHVYVCLRASGERLLLCYRLQLYVSAEKEGES